MNGILLWQQDAWRKLAQERQNGVAGSKFLHHALLLSGRQGIGKLAFANHLAKFLLCESGVVAGAACQRCTSCRWFDQKGHPDFRLVEPEAMSPTPESSTGGAEEGIMDGEAGRATESATGGGEDVMDGLGSGSAKSKKKPSKQISIAQIRELADFVNISSHQNGYKVILIHPAETMNPAAANALLKNLEEPPPQTLFILVSHRAQNLLPTIRSRCRQIPMPAPDSATATAWLKQQGVKDPQICLASAGYAPLAALEFNDKNYLERYSAFIIQISARENFNPVALAEEMQKWDLPTIVNWLQKWCYDLMSFRLSRIIRYNPAMLAAIEPLASELDPRLLATYLRTLNVTLRLAHHTLNPRLFLEEMLFSYIMSVGIKSPFKEQADD